MLFVVLVLIVMLVLIAFFGLSIGDKFVGLRSAFGSMRGVLFQQTDVRISLRLGTRFFLARLRELFCKRSDCLVR